MKFIKTLLSDFWKCKWQTVKCFAFLLILGFLVGDGSMFSYPNLLYYCLKILGATIVIMTLLLIQARYIEPLRCKTPNDEQGKA